jgi:hypothetical protein
MDEDGYPRYTFGAIHETPLFRSLITGIARNPVDDGKNFSHLFRGIEEAFHQGEITEDEWEQAIDELRNKYRRVLDTQGGELESGVEERMAAPDCDLDGLIQVVRRAASKGMVTDVVSERVVNRLLSAKRARGP